MDTKSRRKGIFVGMALGPFVAGLTIFGPVSLGAARFERIYPGFIQQNETLRAKWLAKPPSQIRKHALATVEANLRWAATFRRIGFDPDVFETMAIERELAKNACP